jgi:hypothetical protein
MGNRRSKGALALALGAMASLTVAQVATANGDGGSGAPPEPVTVLTSGLDGPFGLRVDGDYVYVAESGSGEITKVNRWDGGWTSTLVSGLQSPHGVDVIDYQLAIATGGSDVPDASIQGDASLLAAWFHQPAYTVADLEAFELANNPDGQTQFDPATGAPLDTLSNPFSVLEHKGADGTGWVLVADAGANAVLSVSPTGVVTPFFVPPVITTGACAGAPNNDPASAGCDAVPTGLAYGPGNSLYVSMLSAEAPGEGRVYVLDATTGAVRDVITGLDGPTGVAVAPDGTVFVSEVLFGAPAGPPPAGFDPSSVGRIVRIAPDGTRTAAAVTMPTGLDYVDGTLYASAWSTAAFLGIEDAGQIVTVAPSAFS